MAEILLTIVFGVLVGLSLGLVGGGGSILIAGGGIRGGSRSRLMGRSGLGSCSGWTAIARIASTRKCHDAEMAKLTASSDLRADHFSRVGLAFIARSSGVAAGAACGREAGGPEPSRS